MTRFLTPLLLMLAHATHAELIQQIAFLKAENQVLRSKIPGRISLTSADREKLIRYGRVLGSAIKELISIVSPQTFLKWIREETKSKVTGVPKRQRGRPKTDAEIRELVLKLARENGWGYTRILGELKKIAQDENITIKIGRTTIQNLLVANGLDPSPERKKQTWTDFIKAHAETFFACDLLSQKVMTGTGVAEYFLIFFIHIESRRVWASPATRNPDDAWMAEQAKAFSLHLAEQGSSITHLIRDRDGKFSGRSFDKVFIAQKAEVIPLPIRSPNTNAYAERWVQTLRVECLDHFLVMGEQHLNHLVSEFVRFYHQHRPHQGKGNELLVSIKARAQPPPNRETVTAFKPSSNRELVCQEFLGGVLKHYHYRDAA